MPIKRAHKKSRNGCDQCRKRRVKCDEILPRCSICMQRDEDCHYSRLIVQPVQRTMRTLAKRTPSDALAVRPSKALATSSPKFKQQIPTPEGPLDISAVRFLELELMHHWFTRTCATFTPQARALFQDWVPRVGLQHTFLMEALLATTSLHIACEGKSGTDARPYASAALRYQNQALLGLRTALSDLTPGNCHAILVSSIMITVMAMVSPLMPTIGEQSIKSIAEIMKPMVETSKGVTYIMTMSRSWIERGPLGALRTNMPKTEHEEISVFLIPQLRRLNAGRADRERSRIFVNALDQLEEKTKECDVISWLGAMEPAFMERLQQEDSLALAITLQWAVGIGRINNMWWSVYVGRMLVEKLSMILLQKSDAWTNIAMWSREQALLSV